MDVYILDSENRRDVLFDSYESFIWTERYAAFGDFQIVVFANTRNRRLFRKGRRISIPDSIRLMVVDTVRDVVDQDNRKLLIVKGRSLEAILEERIIRPDNRNIEVSPRWNIRGTPAGIARKLYGDICYAGLLNTRDIFPDIIPNIPSAEGRIPEPTETIKVELEPQYLYDAIKDLCDSYELGFRIIWHANLEQLRFQVYTGVDRTAGQSENFAVIFAPGLDNLVETSSLVTTVDSKNVAYVTSKAGAKVVTANGVDPNARSYSRKILLVSVTDLEDGMTQAEIDAYLIQRGREELAKHRELTAFDGEIAQNSQYVYNKHYGLGDLVTVRNDDGDTNTMLVSEQIFASDAEGERAYPTLTLKSYNSGAI